jgi:hypothetical protein
MLELPRAPHPDAGSDDFLEVQSFGTFSKRIRVALEDDQCGCAGAVVREGCVAAKSAAGPSAPSIASRTASRLPRSSSTAVMLSAHCSKVGSAPGVTESEAPVPGWSKKINRPSDAIASTHP